MSRERVVGRRARGRYYAQAYTGRLTMPGKAFVIDADTGEVARVAGKLEWHTTLAAAKRRAAELNA